MSISDTLTQEKFKAILREIYMKSITDEHLDTRDIVEEIKRLIILEVNKQMRCEDVSFRDY